MIVTCDKCGYEVDHTAMFCPSCDNNEKRLTAKGIVHIIAFIIGVVIGQVLF